MPSVASFSFETVDIAVVIALTSEFAVFREIFAIRTTRTVGRLTLHEFEMKGRHGPLRGVAVCGNGEMGDSASLTLTAELLAVVRASYACLVGISGLLSNDLAIGDVVVPREVHRFIDRAKVANGDQITTLHFGGSAFRPEQELVDQANDFKNRHGEIYVEWGQTCASHALSLLGETYSQLQADGEVSECPQYLVGPTASSPFVVTSSTFREHLLSINRNLLAVDMESGGFLEAVDRTPRAERPSALIVRGISDKAGSAKATTDAIARGALRAWAMRNAVLFLRCLLRELPGTRPGPASGTVTDRLHTDITESSIVPAYAQCPLSTREDVARAQQLFRAIQCEGPVATERPIDSLLSRCTTDRPEGLRLCVIGPTGSGKSSFMSAVYQAQQIRFRSKESVLLPVLLDLHRYARPDRAWEPNSSSFDSLSRLDRTLEDVNAYQTENPGSPILFLLDGHDSLASCAQLAKRVMKRVRAIDHVVLATRTPPDPKGDAHFGAIPVITFGLIPANSSRIAEIISLLNAPGGSASRFYETIKRAGVPAIDLFSLQLLLNRAGPADSGPSPLLSAAYHAYCVERLSIAREVDPRGAELSDACRRAFDLLQGRQPAHSLGSTSAEIEFEFLHSHDHIRDFMVANHIIRSLGFASKAIAGRDQRSNSVYPFRLNRFCKEILNADPKLEQGLIDVTGKSKGSLRIEQFPHLCYLLGRVSKRNLQRVAIERLRAAQKHVCARLDKQPHSGPRPPELMLLSRTISISLAYLSDPTASDEYIRRLMSDQREDELNRGFHLEYYDDITFNPDESLLNEDDLRDFPKTFSVLSARLRNQASYPLREIEMYTIFSLAQQRHAMGRLQESKRVALIELADMLLRAGVDSTHLRGYISMVRRHLAVQDFSICTVIEELYALKSIKRAGYVRSGVDPCESVADHTFGVNVLSTFFFRPGIALSFDPVRLHRMLWVHDIAEAITGDLLPKEKDDLKREEERQAYEYLGLLGTYKGVPSTRWISELWEEFSTGSTVEARIANDIDRLENMFQLFVYRRAGHDIPEFDEWVVSLKEALKTKEGREAASRIQAYFDRSYGVSRFTQ